LFNVVYRPCCINCEELNRNTRNRFEVSSDGLLCCQTSYCNTCKDCIIDWLKIKDEFTQKTSNLSTPEQASDELEKFFWTLSHSKRGYCTHFCENCYCANQINDNRFVLNSDGTLSETLSYCNDCIRCNYDCTETYRSLIAKKNSENYNNK
jgi:hypothetical protein